MILIGEIKVTDGVCGCGEDGRGEITKTDGDLILCRNILFHQIMGVEMC